MRWERRRILIWGKTRPEISQTYKEIVCTGGVFSSTRRLVRLYPIPLRFLPNQSVFAKYRWIKANVRRPQRDSRPESYQIDIESVEPLETIPTGSGSWSERAKWILAPGNVFESLEALREQQSVDQTSLGLIQPKSIGGIHSLRYSKSERDSFWKRHADAVAQLDLPVDSMTGKKIKPLSPPEYKFRVKYRCHGQCPGHEMSILDWEVDALYSNLRHKRQLPPNIAARKVVEKLESLLSMDKDVRFFMGNHANRPSIFMIVGLWYPRKKQPRSKQLRLLE